jgi:hypothetical protein
MLPQLQEGGGVSSLQFNQNLLSVQDYDADARHALRDRRRSMAAAM